jgi:hypothetical protein
MAKYAMVVAWIGGAAFTFVYLMRIGNLRDEGLGWLDALFRKNDMVFFGAVGLLTLVAMTAAR